MKKKNCCHRITNLLLLVLCMVAFLTACTSESKKEDQRDIEVRSGHTFDLSKTYSIGILLPDGEIALEYAELIMRSRLQAIPDSSYPDGENRYKKLSPKARSIYLDDNKDVWVVFFEEKLEEGEVSSFQGGLWMLFSRKTGEFYGCALGHEL